MTHPENAILTTIAPRVSETDGCGHINNTVLPIWFEAGRAEFIRAVTPTLKFTEWRLAVVSMTVEFHAQIYLSPSVQVATWVSRVGTKGITVRETVTQNGKLCASGECHYVYFNYGQQSSEAIPEDVRQRLQPMMSTTSQERE